MLMYTSTPREELIAALIERDGDKCFSCEKPWGEGKLALTIDHFYPQEYGKKHGWTAEQIHGIDNLVLMHQGENSSKSNRVPLPDGTLPARDRENLLRVHKIPVCDFCNAGRMLAEGDICPLCGTGPQPTTFPAYLKKSTKECSHGQNGDHCWGCVTGLYERITIEHT